MDLVITTAHKPSAKMKEIALSLARLLNLPLELRGGLSLDDIRAKFNTADLLVVTKNGPVVYTPGGEYFFHLNMAVLRIKNLLNGKHDHMAAAMALTPGMTVLDCTLGLATDAIVASFVVGSTGSILGLETSAVLAAVSSLGLQQFSAGDARINAALRRIAVKNVDYNSYLPTLPDRCFDVVFFDPMFRVPIGSSSNIKPLRFLADDQPLGAQALQHACRVARKRVVVKETNGSPEFSRLDIDLLQGGKYSSVQYGIIEVGD